VAEVEDIALFLLTRDARARPRGMDLLFWGVSDRGPVLVRKTGADAVMFVEHDVPTHAGRRVKTELTTLAGRPVDRVHFSDRRALRDEADRLSQTGTPAFEADVKPADRFLMERFITGGARVRGTPIARERHLEIVDPIEMRPIDLTPTLRVASIDVESEGRDGPVLSIAIVSEREERAFVRGRGPAIAGASHYERESEVLAAFFSYLVELDPDALIGWNLIEFDLTYLEERSRISAMPFAIGRAGEYATVLRGSSSSTPSVARVPGRVVLDGIATMRAATWSFESFSLEHVSHELLGRGKKISHGARGDRLGEILRMYREDLPALVEYNIEDCRLVRDIFAKAELLEFAIERQRLTGLTMDRRAGAVASFDHLYLPRLHRHKRVAPSVASESSAVASPGGFVMDSVPGLYTNVLVLDFKSLYPSIIRTFLVDPLGLAAGAMRPESETIAGFEGARFSRTEHILPGVIESLWAARDRAKERRDVPLSRAIKILMNSFYGVLGTPACRFYDARLATSITRRGHEVLRESRRVLEARGSTVIYGDTDSLFVRMPEDRDEAFVLAEGAKLVHELNAFWREHVERTHRLPSHLEIQLDHCYSRFLMPTMRGSAAGSKKRYAGLVVHANGSRELVVRGLEAVRTDWTPLARDFQRELLRRVFEREPFEDFVRKISDDLFDGRLDDRLIYRKRLRRDVESYAHVPPHVAAALALDEDVREIEYVVTLKGPQPIEKQSSPPDYHHYLTKQLAPAADVVLPFVGTSFERLGGRQLSLF
jgi:DNA polymerase-2